MDSTTARRWFVCCQHDVILVTNADLLRLVSKLTDKGDRSLAAQALARAVGAEELMVFLPDAEADALLPAPGFPQTLANAAEWQIFLRGCSVGCCTRGTLTMVSGDSAVEALGISGEGGAVLVLLGGTPVEETALHASLLLPLVAAALNAERVARLAEAQADAARQAANQTKLLAMSLDRARNALRQALAAAEMANRAKDAFFAALSHELRTPLSPVLMIATEMETDPSLPDIVRSRAAVIRRNAELEARLIDDLLDITRITHGKLTLIPTALDLHEMLAQTEALVSSECAAKQIDLRFEKTAAEHHVLADPTRLQQVFWNVIKNAVKFTPRGGRIRVTTLNENQGRITVQVSDSGVGMERAVLRNIFNAFEQADGATHRFGGLGLGLAITKALVEMHSGSIRAESAGIGRGATFVIEFATVAAPRRAGTVPLHEVQTVTRDGLHLLLVEDHDSTRDVLARILERSGHRVHVASTGAEARGIAAAQRVDLVISDIGLPDESGLDLMEALRAAHDLRGIALSGYGMEEDIRRATAAGFSAHLVKPVNFERLRELLDQFPRKAAERAGANAQFMGDPAR